MPHGNHLHFELTAAQKRGYTNELAHGKLFREVTLVDGVEGVGFVGIEKILDLVFDFSDGFPEEVGG